MRAAVACGLIVGNAGGAAGHARSASRSRLPAALISGKQRCQRGVMMKATPTSPLVMAKPEFLFEVPIVPLDPPAQLGSVHQDTTADARCHDGSRTSGGHARSIALAAAVARSAATSRSRTGCRRHRQGRFPSSRRGSRCRYRILLSANTTSASILAARAARSWSSAICGLVWKTTSSGTPASARRSGSSTHSCGRWHAGVVDDQRPDRAAPLDDGQDTGAHHREHCVVGPQRFRHHAVKRMGDDRQRATILVIRTAFRNSRHKRATQVKGSKQEAAEQGTEVHLVP